MSELTADNLHLWRGDLHVLRGLSFSLSQGQCLQVIGANGAGKSSLLRALCGLLPLESGTVRWRGQDARSDLPAFQRQLAWLAHGAGLKADLTPIENLRYAVGMRRHGNDSAIAGALDQLQLDRDSQRRLVRQLSAGQQRRVGLARVLLLQCPLWILDEPTSNLDEAGQQLFADCLQQHLSTGGAAIIATHQLLGLQGTQPMPLELH